MTDILNATAEIRSFVFTLVSVAKNTEGYSDEEVDYTLALLQQQITARCEAIDSLCQSRAEKSPERKKHEKEA